MTAPSVLETAPELGFAVLGAAPVEHAAAPAIALSLRVEAPGGQAIRSLLLDTQVRIAARARRYERREQERLLELFGPVEQWGSTLRSLLWTHLTLVVPPFTGSTVAELRVPCTYDMDVLGGKYIDALGDDGEVPLELLFSGTVFYAAADGRLQAARISWDEEAMFRLPVSVWRETMDRYFPGTAWLRLPKETFDRLCAYKARNAFASWDQAVDELLRTH